MHIALIGMSNIGKSHWARRRLEVESGFERLTCDDLIEEKLAPHLKKLGYKGIRDVAKWMGQPYDPQYPETSRHYLACESEVMLGVIERLKWATKPLVIDTTGSVIYIDPKITGQMKALSRVVYLQESDQHITQLFESYVANPKPVIWGDAFAPRDGETPSDSMKRCFADLLKFRARQYQTLAHVRIPFQHHRAADATWEKLMTEAHKAAQ